MEEESAPAGRSRPIGRRLFLSVLGVGAVGVAFGSRLQSVESRVLSALSREPGTGAASLVPGGDAFRIYSVADRIPSIADHDYRLSVDGLVTTPRSFTLNELRTLPETALTKDFQCVTGWRVPDVHWRGVLLRDVLAAVRPTASARAVEFGSYDGLYTESLTMPEAMRADVLVAYDMLGAPITAAHGGPVRLYVAPMYGYKSAKWLASITLVERGSPGFWERNGYAVEAWIGRSNGRHDQPVD